MRDLWICEPGRFSPTRQDDPPQQDDPLTQKWGVWARGSSQSIAWWAMFTTQVHLYTVYIYIIKMLASD